MRKLAAILAAGCTMVGAAPADAFLGHHAYLGIYGAGVSRDHHWYRDDGRQMHDRSEGEHRDDGEPAQASFSDGDIHTLEAETLRAHGFHVHHHRKSQCERLHAEYIAEHPTTPPAALIAYHGCERWRLDHAYHSGIADARALSIADMLSAAGIL